MGYGPDVRLVAVVKLLPTPEQASALEATLRTCNQAASQVAELARDLHVYRNYDLRKHCYQHLRTEHGLGAQAAQHVIKKVADAYTALEANLRAGRYGRPGSRRRRRVESQPITFRPDAAQPYDARMLSWQHQHQTISIWTTTGRLGEVALSGSPKQLRMVSTLPVGESDLVLRDGLWFLHVTVTIPDPAVLGPKGFLGVDLGIVNLAHDSDGRRYSGAELNAHRRREKRLRERLQARHTKSATRLLVKRRRREARYARHQNHIISKQIVTVAARTGRGIAVEDLTGIRDRVRLRKPQRVTLSSWSFHQLGQFLAYKARLAGIPLVEVDPCYTSQTCSHCGYRDKRNRPDQATFHCRSCGVVANADHNAARNIAQRAETGRVAVNLPNVA